jgi:hypothetical protein
MPQVRSAAFFILPQNAWANWRRLVGGHRELVTFEDTSELELN